jgi:hypothetical protein
VKRGGDFLDAVVGTGTDDDGDGNRYEICQILAEIAGLPLDHVVPNAENDPNATG